MPRHLQRHGPAVLGLQQSAVLRLLSLAEQGQFVGTLAARSTCKLRKAHERYLKGQHTAGAVSTTGSR